MKRIVYLHHTNELVLFFAVIFAISWLWRGVILALQLPFRSIGFMLEGWAMAGPCVAAVFVTVRHQRRHGVQRLLATALRWRFGLIWYIVALRSVFALSMVAAGRSLVAGGPSRSRCFTGCARSSSNSWRDQWMTIEEGYNRSE